jgi:hypothetical protein
LINATVRRFNDFYKNKGLENVSDYTFPNFSGIEILLKKLNENFTFYGLPYPKMLQVRYQEPKFVSKNIHKAATIIPKIQIAAYIC